MRGRERVHDGRHGNFDAHQSSAAGNMRSCICLSIPFRLSKEMTKQVSPLQAVRAEVLATGLISHLQEQWDQPKYSLKIEVAA